MGASTTRAALSRSILLVCVAVTLVASVCVFSLKRSHQFQTQGLAKSPPTLEVLNPPPSGPPSEDGSAGLAKDEGAESPGGSSDPLPLDMGWQFFFPEILRRRSIGYAGDMLRLKRFLRKVVVERKRFTAVGIGGSVTSDFGGWRGYQGPVLESNFPGRKDGLRGRDGWLTAALDWLTEAFPPLNVTGEKGKLESESAPPYTLVNVGVAATGPGLFEECRGLTFFEALPKEVDLVIIDYAVNYSGFRGKFFAQLDALMQKILHRWSPPPAILFVNFFHWCQRDPFCMTKERIARNELEGGIDDRTWEKLAGTFSDFQEEMFPGFMRAEDLITAAARYYGFPVISVRDALYPLVAGQVPGFNITEIIGNLDSGQHPSQQWSLLRIPELLVSFFQDAIRTLDRDSSAPDPRTEWERSVEEGYLQVPPPLMFDPTAEAKDQTVTKACYSFEVPAFPRPPKMSAKGWAEMEDADSKKPKPGLITRQPGSVVEFEIDTSAQGMTDLFRGNSLVASEAKAQVVVTFLESYERMGEALFACVSGCRCGNGTMVGASENHQSVPAWMTFHVSQSRRCRVRITSKSGKGGSKFKLLGVSVKITAKSRSYVAPE